MARFSFANLTGRGSKPKASETAEGEDAPVEEEEDVDAGAEGEDAVPTEDPEDEAAEDDAEEEQAAAHRKGVAAGRKAERARCAAIFAAAGPGTVAMAAQLAFNTSISPTEAASILGVAPKAEGGLGTRMQGRNPPPASAGGGADNLDDDDKAAQRILSHRRRGKAA